MGETKFFSYSGYDNNCQSFVLNLLNSNGILTNDLDTFIKQNTESIFANNPTLRKLTNNITDLDGRFHEIIGGDIKDKQIQCVNNMSLEELNSLFDPNTGNCLYEFHPDTHELIDRRIKQLTQPTKTKTKQVKSRKQKIKC